MIISTPSFLKGISIHIVILGIRYSHRTLISGLFIITTRLFILLRTCGLVRLQRLLILAVLHELLLSLDNILIDCIENILAVER